MKKMVESKINRMRLIIKFIKEQKNKFLEARQRIYKEYEYSINKILRKTKLIQDIIKSKNDTENENLINNWIKAKHSSRDLSQGPNEIISYLKELLSFIKLNISYFKYGFDEKFVLWIIKNNFYEYLKN